MKRREYKGKEEEKDRGEEKESIGKIFRSSKKRKWEKIKKGGNISKG